MFKTLTLGLKVARPTDWSLRFLLMEWSTTTHFLFTNPLENRVSEKTVLGKFIVEKVDLLGFSDTKCQGVSGVWGFVPDRR